MNNQHTVIRTLEGVGAGALYDAFREAFAEYELQLSSDELTDMLTRRGFCPELSFGAFVDGRLVSFIFNGTGYYHQRFTAYDTGTATLKEFRGRGLVTKLFNHGLPFLAAAGVTCYLLEVLQHNHKAVSVYQSLGLSVSREFGYFSQSTSALVLPEAARDRFVVRRIDLTSWHLMEKFHDYRPSWQNDFEAVKRRFNDFVIFGLFDSDTLIGYCIFEPGSGDITQLAVHNDYRRRGGGSQLLKEAIAINRHHSIKLINAETTCESVERFLATFGIPLRGKQFEMVKLL